MRIVITGDTHLGITSLEEIQKLARRIQADKPDVIAHLGDIGEVRHRMDLLRQVFDVLQPTVGIAGNHDLWRSREENAESYDSLDLWDQLLPRTFAEKGCHYLEQASWVKDGVAIVGSYLHYDYSAQDTEGEGVRLVRRSFPGLTMNEYYERFKKRVNQDGNFLHGLTSDREFAAEIGQRFRQRLTEVEDDETVKKILILTHVPCMPTQITRRLHDAQWSLGTPYFGNLSHVDFIRSHRKVRCIVSGHSHQSNHEKVTFDDGHDVEVLNLDSDYGRPTHIVVDL